MTPVLSEHAKLGVKVGSPDGSGGIAPLVQSFRGLSGPGSLE